MSTTLNGLILTGGFSTRMGRDKALLTYHDGRPQREYLRDVMLTFCAEVFISCRRDQPVPDQLPVVRDAYDFRSPLNGIMSALKSHPDKGWMVVAVDMPFVHAPVLKDLADARNTEKIATCFFNPERSLPEPLLAIWEPTALPVLEAYAAEGMISPQWILQHTDVALAAVRDVKFLLNVNYPTDWPGAIL